MSRWDDDSTPVEVPRLDRDPESWEQLNSELERRISEQYVPPPREEWELVVRATAERVAQMGAPWLIEPVVIFGRPDYGIIGLCLFCVEPILCTRVGCALSPSMTLGVTLEDGRHLTTLTHERGARAEYVSMVDGAEDTFYRFRTIVESHAIQCALQWWSKR